MRNVLLLIVALAFSGCNAMQRLPGMQKDKPAQNNALPDTYTDTGTTTADDQIIQPIRVVGSLITVRVKIPGATEFREANIYEYKADPTGPGGGAVWLRKEVQIINGLLIVTGRSLAPIGTQYEITTTVVKP